MSKIAEYRFLWQDRDTGQIIESPRFATLKAISVHAGRSIEHSRRIVDVSEIDDKGFLKNTRVIGAAPPRRL